MKLTSTSSRSINNEKNTDTAVAAVVTPRAKRCEDKYQQRQHYHYHMTAHHIGEQTDTECRRLGEYSKSSITGMIGNGNFSANGTSGQKMSFQ